MTIIGVTLNKINVEKQNKITSKITIKNNIQIKEITAENFAFAGIKKTGLKFNFQFTCNYEPKLGNILLEGDVLFLAKDEKEATQIKDGWTKTKKLTPDLLEKILNNALTKCNIQALKLSDDMGLPAPVVLPKFRQTEKAKTK